MFMYHYHPVKCLTSKVIRDWYPIFLIFFFPGAMVKFPLCSFIIILCHVIWYFSILIYIYIVIYRTKVTFISNQPQRFYSSFKIDANYSVYLLRQTVKSKCEGYGWGLNAFFCIFSFTILISAEFLYICRAYLE